MNIVERIPCEQSPFDSSDFRLSLVNLPTQASEVYIGLDTIILFIGNRSVQLYALDPCVLSK